MTQVNYKQAFLVEINFSAEAGDFIHVDNIDDTLQTTLERVLPETTDVHNVDVREVG